MDLFNPMMKGKTEIDHTDEKEPVGYMIFVDLKDISSVEECLTFVLEIDMHWGNNSTDPSFKVPSMDGMVKLEEPPEWTPEIFIDECKEEMNVIDEQYWKNNHGVYYGLRLIKATVLNSMNLKRFPFDKQILHIKCYSSNCVYHEYNVNAGRSPYGTSGVPLHVTYQHFDWQLDDALGSRPSSTSEQAEDEPDLSIALYVRRKPEFYLYNIVFPTFIIILCSFGTALVPVDDFSSRTSITLTLLLTVVAFKFISISWLPNIPYLTMLDKYSSVSLFSIFLVVFENFIMGCFAEYEDVGKVDTSFLVIMAIAWSALHCYIIVGADGKWFYEDWREVEKRDSISYVDGGCTKESLINSVPSHAT